jgi:crotonobetainyl-CoA:carnitine CoA-transferase CaiB-like acyl-CoA transferase
VFADPQVQHLGMAAPMRHPEHGEVAVVNQAVALSRTPSVIDRPTPSPGAHTEQILVELGYDLPTVADLRKRRVV